MNFDIFGNHADNNASTYDAKNLMDCTYLVQISLVCIALGNSPLIANYHIQILLSFPDQHYIMNIAGYIGGLCRGHLCFIWCGLCRWRHLCQQRQYTAVSGECHN